MKTAFALTLAALGTLTTRPAVARDWDASAALGTDRWFAPELGGQGFAIFDLRGREVIGGGDFHLYYNTETLQVGVERLPLAAGRLEFSASARAEGALAGVLRYYSQGGLRQTERGFFASYLLATTSLKWLPAESSAVFTDLRFGRLNFHVRVGYALPTPWLRDTPNLSALGMVGLRLF